MGRPSPVRRGPLEPADWPLWVLRFGGGYCPDDPVKQAARRIEFRTWQVLRDEWFEHRGIAFSLRMCNEEHQRRAQD
jgi:hypothetical protein